MCIHVNAHIFAHAHLYIYTNVHMRLCSACTFSRVTHQGRTYAYITMHTYTHTFRPKIFFSQNVLCAYKYGIRILFEELHFF
jgi:hypothetical protein